jgi:hypothetical protein
MGEVLRATPRINGVRLVLVQSIGDILPALHIVESLTSNGRSHLVFLNTPEDLVFFLKANLPENCTYEIVEYAQFTFKQPVSVFANWIYISIYSRKLLGVDTVYYFSNNYDWFSARLLTLLARRNSELRKFIYPHFDALSISVSGDANIRQKINAFLWSLFTGVKCIARNKVRFMYFNLSAVRIELSEIEKLRTQNKYRQSLNISGNKQVIIFADNEEWSHFKNPDRIYDKILSIHKDCDVLVKGHPKHAIPKYFDDKNVTILNGTIPVELYRLDKVFRVYGLITSALFTFQGSENCERISLINLVDFREEGFRDHYLVYLKNSSAKILFDYE